MSSEFLCFCVFLSAHVTKFKDHETKIYSINLFQNCVQMVIHYTGFQAFYMRQVIGQSGAPYHNSVSPSLEHHEPYTLFCHSRPKKISLTNAHLQNLESIDIVRVRIEPKGYGLDYAILKCMFLNRGKNE